MSHKVCYFSDSQTCESICGVTRPLKLRVLGSGSILVLLYSAALKTEGLIELRVCMGPHCTDQYLCLDWSSFTGSRHCRRDKSRQHGLCMGTALKVRHADCCSGEEGLELDWIFCQQEFRLMDFYCHNSS